MQKLLLYTVLFFTFLIAQNTNQPDTSHNQRNDIEMIFVEGGEYLMGDIHYVGRADEFPVHKVKLSDFYISPNEVTIHQWKEIFGGSSRKSDRVTPKSRVSWRKAVYFCNRLSEKYGYEPVYSISGNDVSWNKDANGFRLPTESEWEYAARGGKFSKEFIYSGSNSLDSVAWTGDDKPRKEQPIGVLKPNELGIYDMSGNLAEWCWDYYGNDYYKFSDYENPSGPERGSTRVLRGGSWIFNSTYAKTSYRLSDYPGKESYHYGFRIVRNAR